jgi:hypothetical protein
MKFLSFIARRFKGTYNQLSLKWLTLSHNLDVILIQETMIEGARARYLFESLLKSWSFYIVDADGLLGGFLTGWSPANKSLLASSFSSAITIHLEDKGVCINIVIVNIYGQYINHESL